MLQKHSISIRGHRTSYTLEEAFYSELKKIAQARDIPLAKLITNLDENRSPDQNLSSTLRVFVLEEIKNRD